MQQCMGIFCILYIRTREHEKIIALNEQRLPLLIICYKPESSLCPEARNP